MKQQEAVAWKSGRYIYCMSHGRSQVITFEYLTAESKDLWEGRKCDWCNKQLTK
jgi:hypothetical protein